MDQRWQALAMLTAARATMGVQFQSLASVSPMLIHDVALTYADLGFLIGLYFLPGVVVAMPGGALGRRFGDKRMVVVGLGLMALGGVVMSLANGFAGLATGRLVSGIGAVLLNVLMTKMVSDWFAGREIALAMAVFVNAFPIGIGLALPSLGWLADLTSWAAALFASAALAFAALLLLLAGYAEHPNDGAAAPVPASGRGRISACEVTLVSIAGAIWGMFNGAFAVMFGFAPALLAAEGLTTSQAGATMATATWLLVISVQAGGFMAEWWKRPALLIALGALGWSACLLLMASGHVTQGLIAAGLMMGLPVGIIMSLPAQALRPQNRGVGVGLFYVWLYLGHGGVPPAAGWLQDVSGSAEASLYLAATLALLMLPLFAVFRFGLAAMPSDASADRRPRPGPDRMI